MFACCFQQKKKTCLHVVGPLLFVFLFFTSLFLILILEIISASPMEFAVFALSPSSLVLPSHFPKTTILSRSHISARNKLFQSSRLPSLKNASIFKILSMNKEERRSANYHPSVWELHLIESFSTPYSVSNINSVTSTYFAFTSPH